LRIQHADRVHDQRGKNYSPRLQAILEASRKLIRDGEVLGEEEFWKEVEAARTPIRRGGKRRAARTAKRTA
jgi:hypothetical protein